MVGKKYFSEVQKKNKKSYRIEKKLKSDISPQ